MFWGQKTGSLLYAGAYYMRKITVASYMSGPSSSMESTSRAVSSGIPADLEIARNYVLAWRFEEQNFSNFFIFVILNNCQINWYLLHMIGNLTFECYQKVVLSSSKLVRGGTAPLTWKKWMPFAKLLCCGCLHLSRKLGKSVCIYFLNMVNYYIF